MLAQPRRDKSHKRPLTTHHNQPTISPVFRVNSVNIDLPSLQSMGGIQAKKYTQKRGESYRSILRRSSTAKNTTEREATNKPNGDLVLEQQRR